MMELFLLSAILGLLAVWSVYSFVKDELLLATLSDEIVRIMTSTDRAATALGEPIRRSGTATGSVHRMRDRIRTMLAIPVAGRNGSGILYVNALRTAGRWSFAKMTLHFDRRPLELAVEGTRADTASDVVAEQRNVPRLHASPLRLQPVHSSRSIRRENNALPPKETL